eukprot:14765105-Alexandrium_andersonii.AAC.1
MASTSLDRRATHFDSRPSGTRFRPARQDDSACASTSASLMGCSGGASRTMRWGSSARSRFFV